MLELIDLRNNFTYYYDFYISAKEKSFSEAGRKYFMTPSSLTRSVNKLEDILELKLVKTNNHGFKLTIDGERLFKTLDELFTNNKLIKMPYVAEDMDVTLTIGTTRNIADFQLSKFIIKFNKLYPNVKINILTDNATNLNEYLINHRIDVLIDYLPHINFNTKCDFEIKSISHFKTCFACSKNYYGEIKDKIHSLQDLKKYRIIIPGSSRRRQMLDEVLQVNNITINPLLQMPDSKLMADVVSGCNFIGYFIEDELEEFNLIKIPLKEEMPLNHIGIIYPRNTINNIASEFVKIALEKE